MNSQVKAISTSILIITAIIGLCALKSISTIIQPLLLSILITLLLSPAITKISKTGVPRGLVAPLITTLFFSFIILSAAYVSKSASSLEGDLNSITGILSEKTAHIEGALSKVGVDVNLLEVIDLGKVSKITMNIIGALGSVMSTTFIVFLMSVFMLIEAPRWEEKLKSFSSKKDSIDRITSSINQYLVVKFLTSLATGGLIGASLHLIGHKHWFIMALIAFVLNYIPSLGSVAAAIPAILIAVLTMDQTAMILTVATYVLVNLTVGSILEPKIIGDKLGISTLIILIAMLLWGYMFGIVGMFVSVPITISAKLIMDEAYPGNKLSSILSK